MENEPRAIVFKAFDSDVLTEDIKKIAESELHERESDVQTCLENLKESLRSKISLKIIVFKYM